MFVQCPSGGPEEIRTLDLSDANRTLSQLSYRPKFYQFLQLFEAKRLASAVPKKGLLSGPLALPIELRAHILNTRAANFG